MTSLAKAPGYGPAHSKLYVKNSPYALAAESSELRNIVVCGHEGSQKIIILGRLVAPPITVIGSFKSKLSPVRKVV